MRVIEVALPDELLRRLDQHVSQAGGKDRGDYIRELIEKDIAAHMSLDEILAPFREDVKASGMSDDELTDLFEEAREAVWAAKRSAVKDIPNSCNPWRSNLRDQALRESGGLAVARLCRPFEESSSTIVSAAI